MPKLNLTYNPTYTFDLSEMNDSSDTDMTFRVKSRLSPEYTKAAQALHESGNNNLGAAIEMVSEVLVEVSQGDLHIPINNRDDLNEFVETMDELTEGGGEQFMFSLAYGHASVHWDRLHKDLAELKNSKPLSEASTDSEKTEK